MREVEERPTSLRENTGQARAIKVGIIIGTDDKALRPYCYWEELLQHFAHWHVEYILLKEVDKLDTLDVLILNWDVANGVRDFSPEVLSCFDRPIRDQLDSWVRDGGIFFCEIQSVHGKPVQRSYDRIFPNLKVTVIGEDLPDGAERFNALHGLGYETLTKQSGYAVRGCIAMVNKRHSKHPLVYGVHPFVQNYFSFKGEEVLPKLREDCRPLAREYSLYYRCPETLYSGWFSDWSFGWIPVLLESQSARWPVLLVCTAGKGAWIASTLRLTSASTIPLIRNLINFPLFRDQWNKYHNTAVSRRRKANDIAIISAVITIFLSAGICWKIGVVGMLLQLGNVASAITGISLLGILAAAYKMGQRYRNRHIK